MFKQVFKKYKSKSSPLDLDEVLVLSDKCEGVELVQRPKIDLVDNDFGRLGLIPAREWKIFCVKAQPGLIIVKNPFSWKGQRYWIQKCLKEYPVHPNKTNLDAQDLLLPGENWWNICQTDLSRREVLYKKLRWITLGYHHNWDTKKYSETVKSAIPLELRELCQVCGQSMGGDWTMIPQAAIVNIYHFDSTLSGHIDQSEPNKDAPIFSFSFGGRAIFLIGNSREKPTPVLLESGDLTIMSGESRLAVHGIPKIMAPEQPYPWWNLNIHTSYDEEWTSSFEDYIRTIRININLRQVLQPDQTTL